MHATRNMLRRAGATGYSHQTALESLEQRNLFAVDLIAAFVNADDHTVGPGEDFTAAMVVNNDGNDQSPGFFFDVHLSSDGIFGNADDIVLGSFERPTGLAGDSSASLVRTLTIPDGAAPGTYAIAFRVDPDSLVTESNEDNNTYITSSQLITVTGAPTGVDLDVFGNGQEIADGAHIPSGDNHTAFGDADVGEFVERTFTLTNDGTGTLQILGVDITGANSSDFLIIGTSTLNLAAGESGSLTVRFSPLAEGIRVGSITILTNDTDDGTGDPSSFTFAISGLGHGAGNPLGPEIEIQGNGQVINDGDNSASNADGTNFGRLLPNNAARTRTFTIFNNGDETLTIAGLQMLGRDASDFTILDDVDSIPAGESATFRVRFDPTGLGRKIAQVQIISDDADEGEYTFRLAGRGANNGGPGDGDPEIAVTGLGQNINDGDTSPSRTDGTSFGRVRHNNGTRTRTFTITNSGTDTLDISSITLFGRDADNFTILDAPSAILAGESAIFRVRFDPDGLGNRRADVRILSDDVDEGEFTFRIRGNGTEPLG